MVGLLLIITALLFGAAGCLKPVSLEDYGYVISVGVDKGKEKKYYISLMLQRESSGQNSSESEGGVIVLASEGNDIFDAVNTIENNIPYMLNFSRVNFLFFSRASAEEGMLYDFFEIPLDTLRIRASAIVVITEGDVSEFIGGLAANNDANITKLQSAIMLDRDKTGMVSIMNVSGLYEACLDGRYDFCSALGDYDDSIITDMSQKKSEGEGENPISDIEPGARIGGLKSHIVGSALFDGWVMSGSLDREETMLLNIVTGEFKTGLFAYKNDEDETVTVQLELKRTRIEFIGFDDLGTPQLEIEIELYGGIHQTRPGVTVVEAQEWLDSKVSIDIEKRLADMYKKCIAANSDAMKIGTEVSKHFASAAEWEAYEWKSVFPKTKVKFIVKIQAADKYSAEGMQ